MRGSSCLSGQPENSMLAPEGLMLMISVGLAYRQDIGITSRMEKYTGYVITWGSLIFCLGWEKIWYWILRPID